MKLAGFLLWLAAAGAAAADFRSVQENVAVLYDAPSKAATPLFVVQRNYPLEVIVSLPGVNNEAAWVKVRDATGALTWIERKALGDKRTVLVTAPVAEVRAKGEEGAPLLFSVAQNVVLDLLDPTPGGWLHVRYTDGTTGFIRASAVWGE